MKLDSVSHLSFDSKQGLIIGKGLTKGTESDFCCLINTESGGIERIKAGKIPVIVFGNTKVNSDKKRHIKNSTNYTNKKILKRVNGMLTVSSINERYCDNSSSYARGTSIQ
jgi:hypothetical protein